MKGYTSDITNYCIIIYKRRVDFIFRCIQDFGKVFLEPDSETKSKVDANDLLKGMIERFVLAFALANNLPQILIFFGAMKLGTRLKNDVVTEHFNNYFLVGNLLSVFLAIIYSIYLTKNNILILQMLFKLQ